jgi:hypothetical protein
MYLAAASSLETYRRKRVESRDKEIGLDGATISVAPTERPGNKVLLYGHALSLDGMDG